jgi:carboxyl-terminal processing protease
MGNVQNRKIWLNISIMIIGLVLGAGFYKTLSAGNDKTYKSLKLFSDVIDLVEKNYVDPVEAEKLIQKAIQGMVNSLDPHSSFLPPEAFNELQIDTKGEFGGIGIVITMQKGVLTVISPIEGTPAHKAGIKAGDKIIKINDTSTKGLMMWEAVKKMRGPKKTAIRITIIRKGLSEPKEIKLIRDIIPIESIKSVGLTPGYGYIRITNFNENTTKDLISNLEKLESDPVTLKGLILDLRDNPGGLLDQSINVSDLFIEEGVIVSIKGRLKKHTRVFRANKNAVSRTYPIVVLINGGSASASEIVAGALQDHKKALIIGTTSFGKGSVQTVETLRGGYGLKYTIARYYTPNGRSIQAQGIVPNIMVPFQATAQIEPDKSNAGLLREKDLKNHLEADPDQKDKKTDTAPGKKEKKKSMQNRDNRYAPLTLDRLKTDNQIQRALELLMSYDIFKSGNN